VNIGIVTTWLERGAAYVSRQYRDVLKTKHKVFIYARGGESYAKGNPYWEDDHVTWDKQSLFRSKQTIQLDDFQAWLKRNRIDVVFFNEQHQWEPVLLCNMMNIKTGCYVDYYTKETVPFFQCYDFLICNTRRHYSVFDWHTQSYFIPWGTDINVFKPMTLSPVTPGFVTFFHSGGMSPERKGTDLVLQAFSRLKGKKRIIIHVQRNLNRCFPKLKTLIDTLTEEKKLICYEKTVSAPGLYHLGDVYVYPSRLEGIGLTIAEALACGLPVITSDNPPMNEFIDGSNGNLTSISDLFPREDEYYWPQCTVNTDHLAENMQYYLENSDLLEGLKSAARDYAEHNLDWAKNTMNLSSLLESVQKIPHAIKSRIEDKARLYDQNIWSMSKRLHRLMKRTYRILSK
jgi:glycosyltransferase involved in cell wall biosynthesis